MSFSLNAIYRNATWAIRTNSSGIAKLQEQASSGQVINRTSDDPSAANQILSLRSDSRSLDNYLTTISDATSVLEFSSSVLQDISGQLASAGNSLMSVMSGTTNPQTRISLANDINNTLEQLVSLANTQRLGQRLFSGADSNVDPYTVVRNTNGYIKQVTYVGGTEERNIEVADGVEISAFFTGDSLFRADQRQTPVFYGSTGAAAGSGTSSARGDVMLVVTGSPGAYELSIDGGAARVAVADHPTPENIPVVNSTTGEVLYVDATGITATGNEPVQVTGTYDIFNILIGMRDLLRNADNIPADQWKKLIDHSLESLKEVEQKFVRCFPIVGGRISTLENLQTSLENIKQSTDDQISRKQDADIAQIAVDLARYDVLYQMSLSVAAKLFSTSMLDFLE